MVISLVSNLSVLSLSLLISAESSEKAFCLFVIRELFLGLAESAVVNTSPTVTEFFPEMGVQHLMKEDIGNHVFGNQPAVEPAVDNDSAVCSVEVAEGPAALPRAPRQVTNVKLPREV